MKRTIKLLTLLILVSAVLTPGVRGSTDLDRRFSLTSVGFLRSWDNVDGLFADYVAAAYKDYFSRQSRFVLQDLSKADSVLSRSKLPYFKLIEDADVLGQIARATRAESVIRTRIRKEGSSYRFSLEWLHSPGMEVMSSDEFVLQEPEGGQAIGLSNIQPELQASLERMIGKVPFIGQITGRDEGSVTVDIGARSRVSAGDQLVIVTIDEAKRHPLLKAIVDWRLTETGRVAVEQVEERIAFGKIVSEEPGRRITRYQKISRIMAAPEAPSGSTEGGPKEAALEREIRDQIPRLGYLSAGPLLGSAGRDYTLSDGTGKTGGGLFFGGRAEAQLWLNRNWFTELGMDFGTWSQSQTDVGGSNPTGAGNADMTNFRINGGYTHLLTSDFFGPRGWFRFGYKARSFSLPTSQQNLTGTVSFSGLFVGIGGELPIRDRFGALLNIDYGIFTSATQTALSSGTFSSATDAAIYLGGFYRFDHRLSLRVGLDFSSQSATFDTGGTLSHKETALIPSVVFYF